MTDPNDSPPHARVGHIVAGRYRLGESLGSGGMASVYRADDEFLGRPVAVKLFHADLTNAGDERRQKEETSLLASLNHPALVTLFDAGRDADDAFLVMEFVEGPDLRVRLGSGALDADEAAKIGTDIASALAYIHARGVVHRDIKPANILLPAGSSAAGMPHAKLADFGIARLIDSSRLTATGTLIGTASYLSPEQARGGSVAEPSDVYSLSLVLLESLTGRRAFPGTAVESSIARLSRDPVIPDTLAPAWVRLLRDGTARDPGRRPSAEELTERLRALSARTAVLPIAPDDITERLAPQDVPTARFTAAEPTPPHHVVHHRAGGVALGLAAAVAATAVAVIIGVNSASAPPPSSAGTTVDYPGVDGELGVHLTQLQESVAP